MSTRIPVAVLGATGVVGQRFVAQLARHPWFEIAHLGASGRSAGQRYSDACRWRVPHGEAFGGLGDRRVEACDARAMDATVVFSALDSAAALELEPEFARAGAWVFSNASSFRMEPDVPLLVPEVNAGHVDLVQSQRRARRWKGAIVCNPNCTTAVAVTALAPLHERFGVEQAFVVTLQALSGAGYPGVASLDALGNVVPYIAGEEEKVELETGKILGSLEGERVTPAALAISAACHRVPVADGHGEAISVRLRGSPAVEVVREALATWRSEPQLRSLPTAPPRPIVLHDAPDRPQPRLDVERDGGMSVHVGRVRPCPLLGIKMFVLGHNLERGAAGASVLNAELCHARGLLRS